MSQIWFRTLSILQSTTHLRAKLVGVVWSRKYARSSTKGTWRCSKGDLKTYHLSGILFPWCLKQKALWRRKSWKQALTNTTQCSEEAWQRLVVSNYWISDTTGHRSTSTPLHIMEGFKAIKQSLCCVGLEELRLGWKGGANVSMSWSKHLLDEAI